MKRAPRSLQHHVLYRKYNGQDSEISALLGKCGFKGLSSGQDTIEGKYFNKIVSELRGKRKGQTIDQVLAWLTTMHGYLSSPTGGGVRHGVDLKSGITIDADEGRLYCNLIRSYVTFLMAEHERMTRV